MSKDKVIQTTVEDVFGRSLDITEDGLHFTNSGVATQCVMGEGGKWHHPTLSNVSYTTGKKESLHKFLIRCAYRACLNKSGREYDNIVAWIALKIQAFHWEPPWTTPPQLFRSVATKRWGTDPVKVVGAMSKDVRYNNNMLQGVLGFHVMESWSSDDAQTDAFICMYSQVYFSKKHHRSVDVVELGPVHSEFSRHYFLWSDGKFHNTNENWKMETTRHQMIERDSGRIPAYHSIHAPWRTARVVGNKPKFGIENEMFVEKRRLACNFAEDFDLIGEEDGSLDHIHGIEIIGEPMEAEQICDDSGPWMKFLKKVGDEAGPKEPPNQNYGMHISISRSTISEDNQSRFVYFIHSNPKFCKRVAGRESESYCKFAVISSPQTALQCSRGKTFAVNVSTNDRMEVRMFRYHYKPEVMKKNIEFLSAALEFSDKRSQNNLTEERFMEWFQDKKERFPNLSAFLDGPQPDPSIHQKQARDVLMQFVSTAQAAMSPQPATQSNSNE